MAGALMLQGTGSDVGKSLVTAGLCRAFTRRGLVVRPFKPQNMSNNAAVASDGQGGWGEIGRAQAVQALACRTVPHVDMNPVLLKPQSEIGAQVVVRGRVMTVARADAYQRLKPSLLRPVLDSFARLRGEADLVVVEGAGSAAEVNLREGDIANMGFARAADVPVILVGDIDRGGVIASLVGIHAVLEPDDRALVKGWLINKFRGDPRLFDGGMRVIAERTGWPALGLLPHLPQARDMPAEDGFAAPRSAARAGAPVRIAVPLLPHIANADDLDPLRADGRVDLRIIRSGLALPGDADAILLPGSKATVADLGALRAEGWDIDIQAHHRRGGRVLGLCGGFQMLGRWIHDPHGAEGPSGAANGLGLLAVETVLVAEKTVRPASGRALVDGTPVKGYEIHLGETGGDDCDRPLFALEGGGVDGARSRDDRVRGTYLHGLFTDDAQRAAWLRWMAGGPPDAPDPQSVAGPDRDHESRIDSALDAIADACAAHLDLDALYRIATA